MKLRGVSVWPFPKAQRIKEFYDYLEILLILSSRCPVTNVSFIFPSNPVGSYQVVRSFIPGKQLCPEKLYMAFVKGFVRPIKSQLSL